MEESSVRESPVEPTTTRRRCVRNGCGTPVKKPTAKYCSVGCCASDPARQERLRSQSRRGAKRKLLPMARQLTLGLQVPPQNPEAALFALGDDREDVPGGLARLTG